MEYLRVLEVHSTWELILADQTQEASHHNNDQMHIGIIPEFYKESQTLEDCRLGEEARTFTWEEEGHGMLGLKMLVKATSVMIEPGTKDSGSKLVESSSFSSMSKADSKG